MDLCSEVIVGREDADLSNIAVRRQYFCAAITVMQDIFGFSTVILGKSLRSALKRAVSGRALSL